MEQIEKKIRASILGFVIGDCLGVPYEFTQPKISKVKMVGYRTHRQPPGTWSDDTALILATMDCKFRKVANLRQSLLKAVNNGKYYPDHMVFDVGAATATNLRNFHLAELLPQDGNGSMMRMLPYAFIKVNEQDRANLIWESSYLTHKSALAAMTATLYVELVRCFVNNPNTSLQLTEFYEIADRLGYSSVLTQNSTITNRGFCKDSLQIVIDVVRRATSFKHGMKLAINYGGDTDTHAALAGAILALRFDDYKEYVPQIRKRKTLDKIINKFIQSETTNNTV